MATVSADFSRVTGPMKPLHGLNCGPKNRGFFYDVSDHFRTLGIPFARLHDIEYPYGGGQFIDIPAVFPRFDADEEDPASYNFTMTDHYLETIQAAGTDVIYRLGVSIEHAPVKLFVYPPKDYQKWARICEHIIRHVNDGWANGHHRGIRYWEIWNEPNIGADMWNGTAEDYYRLYQVSATYLKETHPDILIGGPVVAYIDPPFLDGFFSYITDPAHPAPLDFFSWHNYTKDPADSKTNMDAAHDFLQKYGFPHALSVCNEWNYVDDWAIFPDCSRKMMSQLCAAYTSAVFYVFQNGSVDISANYGSWLIPFNTIFDATMNPTRAYYSFLNFRHMVELGLNTAVSSPDHGVYACAARREDGSEMILSLSKWAGDAEETVTVTLDGLDGSYRAQLRLLDNTHDLTPVQTFPVTKKQNHLSLTMQPYQVAELVLTKES